MGGLAHGNDHLPWLKGSARKIWRPDFWYPVPMTHDIEYLGEEETVHGDSWDLFRLDPQYPKGHALHGDIDSLGLDLTFIGAVKLANTLNPEKLWTASWIKASWAQKKWPIP